MSVTREVLLECDGLGQFVCLEAIAHSTAALARDEAARNGWQVNAPGGKDYCPEHRKTKPRGAK